MQAIFGMKPCRVRATLAVAPCCLARAPSQGKRWAGFCMTAAPVRMHPLSVRLFEHAVTNAAKLTCAQRIGTGVLTPF